MNGIVKWQLHQAVVVIEGTDHGQQWNELNIELWFLVAEE